MKNINDWNKEYGSYHLNKTNKIIHWICIPLIIFSLFGLLSIIEFDFTINEKKYKINILVIFIILTLGYYLRLSRNLAIGMLVISIFLKESIDIIALNTKIETLYLYLGIFIIAWIGQFIGHKFEGKKPAFLKDLQFLLIGPLWLLSYIYNKLNIKI
tara:strand:- start:31328 stop:31798 length:471 start_codon:yes stop_codon:yes gene_type:complete